MYVASLGQMSLLSTKMHQDASKCASVCVISKGKASEVCLDWGQISNHQQEATPTHKSLFVKGKTETKRSLDWCYYSAAVVSLCGILATNILNLYIWTLELKFGKKVWSVWSLVFVCLTLHCYAVDLVWTHRHLLKSSSGWTFHVGYETMCSDLH